MRMLLPTTMLIISINVASADEKGGDATNDQRGLQGLWQAVSLEAGGEEAPPQEISKFQLLFKGDKVIFIPKADNREHTYDIDPGKKPKRLDITPGDGAKKGKRLPCAIYELTGDKLILCIDKEMQHAERPSEFETEPGDGLALIILERVKPAK